MNIAHIEERSFIYGPGCRFVIWVQGCSIRCKGCWNREMWGSEPNIVLSVDKIFEMIVAEKGAIEGITVLGGEPLDQTAECVELLRRCGAAGLTTMLFTGYEIGEIRDRRLFDLCDILITGRYNESQRTLDREWIGSTNQEIHFLGEAYRGYELKNANYMEIGIDEDGSVTLLGFPNKPETPIPPEHPETLFETLPGTLSETLSGTLL